MNHIVDLVFGLHQPSLPAEDAPLKILVLKRRLRRDVVVTHTEVDFTDLVITETEDA